MDLIAYKILNSDDEISKMIKDYVLKNYGDVPRCRGVRLMKIETPVEEGDHAVVDVNDILGSPIDNSYYTGQNYLFNKYAGQDVIYIHTRCGDCGMGYDDEDSNYVSCGAKDWEENNHEVFLDHITDSFDSTYCTHYFKAIIDDDYNAIINKINEVLESEEE